MIRPKRTPAGGCGAAGMVDWERRHLGGGMVGRAVLMLLVLLMCGFGLTGFRLCFGRCFCPCRTCRTCSCALGCDGSHQSWISPIFITSPYNDHEPWFPLRIDAVGLHNEPPLVRAMAMSRNLILQISRHPPRRGYCFCFHSSTCFFLHCRCGRGDGADVRTAETRP